MSTGQVYFVEGPGRIKIGFTTKPAARLRQLQSRDMERLSTIAIVDGSRKLERHIHAMAKQYRLHYEWFKDCREVREIIDNVVRGRISVPDRLEERQRMAAIQTAVATLVDYEAARTKSRMCAYENVARSIGVSASWVRKFVANDDGVGSPRIDVVSKIKILCFDLCERIERDNRADEFRLRIIRGELDAITEGFGAEATAANAPVPRTAETESKS